MAQRAAQFCAGTRAGVPVLIPAEQVGAFVVALPKGSRSQHTRLLPYAVEDRIGQPIETMIVAPAPLAGAGPGQILACVVSFGALATAIEASRTGAAPAGALPEFLLIRRPVAPAQGMAWAVWRDGLRAIVRVSDGTGFGAGIDMLPLLWRRAGCPVLTSLGAALPSGLPATDLSMAPPDPDPADLAFRFVQARTAAQTAGLQRPLLAAAMMVVFGLAAHLALAAVDAMALGRIVATAQDNAQAALDRVMPGVQLTPDIAPILARLAPVPTQPRQGTFLPLIAEVSDTLAAQGPDVTLQRLGWRAEDGALRLVVMAAGLADLQALEQVLQSRGFLVQSGAATAGDGGATVDLTITRAIR